MDRARGIRDRTEGGERQVKNRGAPEGGGTGMPQAVGRLHAGEDQSSSGHYTSRSWEENWLEEHALNKAGGKHGKAEGR